MIGTAVDQCYECQVATKGDREEPIKVTSIPSRPRDTVSIDHGGPFPERIYNLVLIDKRTRYPVLESVPSPDFQNNKKRLKHIFATNGTPRRIESDNGPPFNSEGFNEFAKQEGSPPPKNEWRSREIHANPKQDRTNCKSATQKPS